MAAGARVAAGRANTSERDRRHRAGRAPVTVEDLLTFRAGWGFPSDFSLPAVVELFQKLPVFGPREAPDDWLATLARVPMLRQPGEAWLYNTCSDIQGVLVARVSGRSLPGFLADPLDCRYGWVGGTGTSAHVVPSTGTVGIVLTQQQMTGPTPTPLMRGFWQIAFGGADST